MRSLRNSTLVHLLAVIWFVLSPSAVTLASATDDIIICIKYETHFEDWEMGDYYKFSSPHDYDAIRPHVRVRDNDTSSVIYNSYTNPGNCTPTLSLDSAHDFEIKVYAAARLSNNNEIKVYDNYLDPVWHAQVLSASWNPLRDGTYTLVHQYNSTFKVSNVLAAAGWAVDRRHAGLSNLDITYFTDPCPGSTNSCFQVNGGNHRIMIGPDDLDRKSTITHETGHEILYQKNGNDGHTNDCTYEGTGDCWDSRFCDTCHCNRCLEYQSCASWEGFAEFYMVAAWNDAGGADCDYNDNNESCENDGNWISEGNCCQTCFGRATEWDWVHFWWDMYSDEGYAVSDIAQIYNISNPENWDPWYDVYYLIKDAAMDFGVSESVWDDWADFNGIGQ
ncbi:MAG: hypothetical protein IT350_15355 [Deltaproteobacteria bacterium]|nr:hypothetical protein [Deltaproteobacteria bacterium]